MDTDLDRLKGMNKRIKNILLNNRITNLSALAIANVSEIASFGIDRSVAMNIINQATHLTNSELEGTHGFITGDELLKKFEERQKLSTCCPSIDEILGGGIETQKIYEFYGRPNAGKTIFMHQLLCNSYLPLDKGGLGSPAAIYIDTKYGFNIQRIQAIAKKLKLDPVALVKGITHIAPRTSDELLYQCEQNLESMMEKTGAKIIILDNLAVFFRSEYGIDLQDISIRQNKALRVITGLHESAKKFNAAAVMTNQVSFDEGEEGIYDSHALGLAVGHKSQIRIKIESLQGNLRKIITEKAVDLPVDECIVELTPHGFHEIL